MATIIFESSDGKRFKVPIEQASYSTTIKTMLDDLGLEETRSPDDVIPILNVSGLILEKVLEWAKHEQEEPTGRIGENGNPGDGNEDNELTPWETQFLKIDHNTLYALTRAANYLDVKGLLDLCCTAVAIKLMGKNPREIRELFGLPWPTVEKKNKQRNTATSTSSSPSA